VTRKEIREVRIVSLGDDKYCKAEAKKIKMCKRIIEK